MVNGRSDMRPSTLAGEEDEEEDLAWSETKLRRERRIEDLIVQEGIRQYEQNVQILLGVLDN